MKNKRDSRGFSHHFILPIIAIFAVGAIGVVTLNMSGASSPKKSCTAITFGRYKNSHISKYKSCVKAIQKKVGASADGIFGNNTSAKVKAWQKNHGLRADGVVGPKTWAKMGIHPTYKVTVASKPKENTTQFCRQSGEGGVWSSKAKKCVKVGSSCKTLILLTSNDGKYNSAGVCKKN
jgi:hypothetical protein